MLGKYVYDNSEVKLTNRKSEKTLGSGKKDVLYEITPIDPFVGSWKKWVRLTDLYKIVDEE
jgi:hypothetical protein